MANWKVAVRTTGVLVIVEVLGGIEVHHLAGDLAVVLFRVHRLDAADAALAGQKVFPKIVLVVAVWGNDSHAGDDDATLAHVCVDWGLNGRLREHGLQGGARENMAAKGLSPA
jgi:hypothetical protein